MTLLNSSPTNKEVEKPVTGLQDNMLQVQGRLDKIKNAMESLLELRGMMEQLMKFQMGMFTESNKNTPAT